MQMSFMYKMCCTCAVEWNNLYYFYIINDISALITLITFTAISHRSCMYKTRTAYLLNWIFVEIFVNMSASNVLFFLHLQLFSSTVVEPFIGLSDVNDQQVIGIRGKVSHKVETRERIHYVISGRGFCPYIFIKDERRLVLMRAVPVPHDVYSG